MLHTPFSLKWEALSVPIRKSYGLIFKSSTTQKIWRKGHQPRCVDQSYHPRCWGCLHSPVHTHFFIWFARLGPEFINYLETCLSPKMHWGVTFQGFQLELYWGFFIWDLRGELYVTIISLLWNPVYFIFSAFANIHRRSSPQASPAGKMQRLRTL